MTIDPNRGWRVLEGHVDRATNPRVRQLLETVREHLYAEATCDFDLLLSTLAPDPQYHFWGSDNGFNFNGGPKGIEAVTAHYRGVYEENRQVCDWEIDRVVADEDCVATEGFYRQLYPGWAMRGHGADVDDTGAVYEIRARLMIVWPCDADGKLTGEDAYSDGSFFVPGRFRKLDPSEVPDTFYLKK